MAERRPSSKWLWPPADQWVAIWGPLAMALSGVLTLKLVWFLRNLSGTVWISLYVIGLLFSLASVGLIFFAKLPLYRQRRFLSFGIESIPEDRRDFYRWGYRCFWVGAAILASLLLSGR